jgi:hypothetical protein
MPKLPEDIALKDPSFSQFTPSTAAAPPTEALSAADETNSALKAPGPKKLPAADITFSSPVAFATTQPDVPAIWVLWPAETPAVTDRLCELASAPPATLASWPACADPWLLCTAKFTLPEPASPWLRIAICADAKDDLDTFKEPWLSISSCREYPLPDTD